MLKTGETTSDDRNCGQITPEIGVTSTPVVDRASGPNGAIYVVAMSKDASGNYHQRLHALDLALGTELFGGPVDVQATYPGTGDNSNSGTVVFDPGQYAERSALLLLNGVIYTGWTSHCDIRPYTGWIMGYSESTLAQTSVLNVTPNGNEGSIWMCRSGAGRRQFGQHLFSRCQWRLRHELNCQRTSQRRRLRQRIHEALNVRRPCRGGLLRDGQWGSGERQRHRPGLWAERLCCPI